MSELDDAPKNQIRPHRGYPPPTRRDIAAIGAVTLRSASMNTVIEAQKLASAAEAENQGAAFTNFLIAKLLEVPQMTTDQLAALPDEPALSLVEAAADALHIRKDFDNTVAELPPRARLYQAYQSFEHALHLELLETFKNSLGAPLERIYGDMAGTLRALTLSAGTLDGIGAAFQQMAALNLKLEGLSLLPEIPNPTRHLQQLVDVTSMINTQSLQQLVAQLAKASVPEPFYSDALFASGLNSSIIHTPTYALPQIQPITARQDIKPRAEVAGHRKLVDAYDILSTLEQALRDFIMSSLHRLHGASWWKQGVPEAVRNDCEQRKQEKEKPLDRPYHPIYYAYVDGYKTIIVRRDNWDKVFGPIFGNKIELEACFAWVGRVRDPVAHSRPILENDYMQLVVAARWLHTAMSRSGAGTDSS